MRRFLTNFHQRSCLLTREWGNQNPKESWKDFYSYLFLKKEKKEKRKLKRNEWKASWKLQTNFQNNHERTLTPSQRNVKAKMRKVKLKYTNHKNIFTRFDQINIF